MTSFEELNLSVDTVASLAADGIEVPTPFQAAAIPVLARGNDLLGRAGPGSGTLVAYGAPLLDRLQGGSGAPVCVILCTGNDQATGLARSWARICEGSEHRSAALAERWVLPEHADFLFVPADRFSALYDGSVVTTGLKAVVFHDGDGVLNSVPEDTLEVFLSRLPKDCQRIFCGLPFGDGLRSLARRFTRRAVTIPPGAGQQVQTRKKKAPSRELNVVVVDGERQEAALSLAADLLDESVRHLLVFASSADQAADVGDFLTLHGYTASHPGDTAAPVWLCPGDDESAIKALAATHKPETVGTLSFSVPPDARAAGRRHLTGGPAWILVRVRELKHLKEAAAGAGLRLRRIRPQRPARVSATLQELAERVGEVARAPQAAPYYLLVESLLDRHTAAEVAAAALLLLDREQGSKSLAPKTKTHGPKPPAAWIRLFVSAGHRDQIGAREILGAVASESGIPGKRVGRIDVRESYSLVEVREADAQKVISAVNGTTLGGRAVRVDYDRPKGQTGGRPERTTGSRPSQRGPRGPSRGRPPTGKPGPRSGGPRPRKPWHDRKPQNR